MGQATFPAVDQERDGVANRDDCNLLNDRGLCSKCPSDRAEAVDEADWVNPNKVACPIFGRSADQGLTEVSSVTSRCTGRK